MHVAFVTSEIAECGFFGGLGRYVQHMASLLTTRGHTCDIFLCASENELSRDSEGIRKHGCRLIGCPMTNETTDFDRLPVVFEIREGLAAAMSVAESLESAHSRRPYDVIHVTSARFSGLFVDLPVPMIARFDRDLALVRQSYGLSQTSMDSVAEMLERAALRTASYQYAPNSLLAGRLHEMLGLHVPIIPPPAVIDPARDEWDTAWCTDTGIRNQRSLLFVGPLSRVNGAHVLADALPRVFSECPDAHIHLVGLNQGSWEALLDQSGGFRSHIHYHGFQEGRRLYPMVEAARGVVAPAVAGGQTHTVIEAMALGTPVIAPSQSGHDQLMTGSGAGLLVHPNRAGDLADAMIRILTMGDDERCALGERGRVAVARDCSATESVDRFVSLCQNAVEHGPIAPLDRHARGRALCADICAFLGGTSPLAPAPKQDMQRRLAAVAERLRKDGIDGVVVYGAGEAGRIMVGEILARGIEVLYLVDRDPRLQGKVVTGLEVVSLEDAVKRGATTFAIASLAFAGEMVRTIQKRYDRENVIPRIFSPL
ncbi:MAG: glycosyltransferase [Acidobacteria bacterium]|nr:glycosyltransferase [Acidobacteriota bacterium]